MTRTQRTFVTMLLVLGAGGAAFAWAIRDKDVLAPERVRLEEEGKRLFRFGEADVKGGVLHAKGLDIKFVKDGSGFKILEPISWLGETEAFRQAIGQMAAIRADSEVVAEATEKDLAEYGLAEPQTWLTVELESGVKHTLYIGARNELQRGYNVTDENKKRIVFAHETFYASFDRDLFAFRDKHVFTMDREQIARIEVRKRKKLLYVIERADSGFMVGESVPDLPADEATISRFLAILTRDLTAERIVTDEFDASDDELLQKTGLAEASFSVTIIEKDGTTHVARVGVGKPLPGKDEGPPPAFIVVEGLKSVIEVYPNFPSDLDRKVAELRDRALSRFETAQVLKVDLVTFRFEKATVQRDADGAPWRTVPEGKKVKDWKVDALLSQFARLRSGSIHQDDATAPQLEEWKLEPPQQRFTFYGAGDEILGSVDVGRDFDETQVLIRKAGDRRVDLIQMARLRVVPASLAELVESAQ